MTAIVGLVADGTVYIGGDSAGSNGWSVSVRQDAKVFKNGHVIMGFTDSFRMGQLLRFSLLVPDLPEKNEDLYAWMVTDFIESVRLCLKGGGFAAKNNETESGGTFLVGVRGRLFEVNSDYQVGEEQAAFNAVGSGYLVALGALHATEELVHNPVDRVRSALEAAEQYTASVRGPYTIMDSQGMTYI